MSSGTRRSKTLRKETKKATSLKLTTQTKLRNATAKNGAGMKTAERSGTKSGARWTDPTRGKNGAINGK